VIEIREERPDDVTAVRDLNRRAFGQEQESNIVDALRTNGAALLSLVATLNDQIVGHIMYSPVIIGGNIRGTALGPMAVLPEYQRQGIGSKLIEAGNQKLKDAGCPFICCRSRGLLSPIRIQTRQRTWNQMRMGRPQ
jgi:putative acetyltransferase